MLKIINLGDGRIYSGYDAKNWPNGLYLNTKRNKPPNRLIVYKYGKFLYGICEEELINSDGRTHISEWSYANLFDDYTKVEGILL